MKRFVPLILFFLLISTTVVLAQCPMCGEAARTSLKEGNNTARGINSGIGYLLAGPYLLIIAGGIIWYRARKKAKRAQALAMNAEQPTA